MGHGPTFSDDCADSSLCRVKLDPNALIKERYAGILTATEISSFVTSNIVLKSGRSVILDCHSNFSSPFSSVVGVAYKVASFNSGADHGAAADYHPIVRNARRASLSRIVEDQYCLGRRPYGYLDQCP
jgi:hypothetical protein